MLFKLVLITSIFFQFTSGFHLPGLIPHSYCRESSPNELCKTKIDLYVNRLTSVESVIPYDYSSFDFCEPEDKKGQKGYSENLGQVLFGERIHTSPYHFTFDKNETCQKVCDEKTYKANDEKLEFLKYGMLFSYENYWIVDNMPVAWCYKTTLNQMYCSTGFPMGCYVNKQGQQKDACLMDPMYNEKDTYYLFNHVDIKIRYHSGRGRDWSGARLVKITLQPKSFKNSACSVTAGPLAIPREGKEQVNITYTYSVHFIRDDSIEWASRCDYVLDNIQPFRITLDGIINSVVIIIFLSAVVSLIMVRTLRNGTSIGNQEEPIGKIRKTVGWKLIQGDVFRAPRESMLFAVLVGVGTQIILMTSVTLLFACFGFLSPANRGALATTAIYLFLCFAVESGYVSARLYKTFGGEDWKMNARMTAFLVSGVVISMILLMNFIYWGAGSSAAIPFFTLLLVFAFWFGISAPLTFVGAYFGYKRKRIEHPVHTNEVLRQIPPRRIYTCPLTIMMGGILPFSCIFIQLFFILNSIWSYQIYYMFGFLYLVMVLLIIICSETSIIICYFHLASEDYRWWWRSFLTSGFTAVYFLIYSIHFYVTKLEIEGVTSAILYFGYSLIMAICVFLFCGTIGFFACFWFVTKLYSTQSVQSMIQFDQNSSVISNLSGPSGKDKSPLLLEAPI